MINQNDNNTDVEEILLECKYSNYSKQGSVKKETNTMKDLVKIKQNNKKAGDKH